MDAMQRTNRFDPKDVRRELRMNQQEFWSRIGVAQSCGSRYEAGRRMPRPVQELLRVVYIERIDLSAVNAHDFAILHYLKTFEPDAYRRLSEVVGDAGMKRMVLGRTVAKPLEGRLMELRALAPSQISNGGLPALQGAIKWARRSTDAPQA